nr:bacillithiol biosynthesis cysteine-adding enzyme BshC [candidate division Zixibacteria bacterium]
MMTDQLITPTRQFNHSQLYLNFLKNDPGLKKYLYRESPQQAAENIGPSRVDRDTLCDVLVEQNKEFMSRPRAFGSIESLRQKDALCIFSGQQSGLFGGPLLTLFKAIDTVKRARMLEKQLDRPVVPVFWIACDDHDFAEVNHTYYINSDGEPTRVSYEPANVPPLPVSRLAFDDEDAFAHLAEEARLAFGGTDFSEELLNRISRAYAPGESLTRAFAKLLSDILPDLGLVFFCPDNRVIKEISKDFFKRIVESYFRLKQALKETSQNLENDNYHIQAEKKESAAHLFYHNPGREPIHYLDEAFHYGDKRVGLPAMLDLIDRNPEDFSTDVLTRPLWQSYLFPVVAQIGGPAEIAYFCQIGGLFKLYDITQPYYYPRVSATIIEKRTEELFRKFNLKLSDLTGDIEQTINRMADESFPREIMKKMERFRKVLDDAYLVFENDMVEFDDKLEPMSKQTYGKIDYAIKEYEKKIFAAHKRKMKDDRNQIYRMVHVAYPGGKLQERSLNINYFISKYGFGVVDYIVDNLNVETTDHQMIYLSRYTG